jgi:hypothetical protein
MRCSGSRQLRYVSFPYKSGCGTVPGSENVAEQTRGGAMETYSCTIYIYSRLYLKKKNRNLLLTQLLTLQLEN